MGVFTKRCACGCGELIGYRAVWKNAGHMKRTQVSSPRSRFAALVEKGDSCWLWKGAINNKGYGYLSLKQIDGRWVKTLAHRFAFKLEHGAIPPGKELDHLCRNPACVRPDHLEAVSHKENILRGLTGSINRARQLALTHCRNGHEFTAENTYIWPARGTRQCRTCQRHRQRRKHR